VLAATTDYLETADAFGRWLSERCVVRPNGTMSRAAAFGDWKVWAELNGDFVGPARRLVELLSRVPGVHEGRIGRDRTRVWLGVGLRQTEDQ